MAFVQIIEFRTSDIEGVRRIDEEWRRATEGRRTVRRELLARDHSDPDRYFAVVWTGPRPGVVAPPGRPGVWQPAGEN
jgi:hypothetical protein